MAGAKTWQQQGEVQYRRGAIMGLTVAESFMLITFLLLMLLALWRIEKEDEAAGLRNAAALARVIDLEASATALQGRPPEQTSQANPGWVAVPRTRLAEMESRARLVAEADVRHLAEAAAALDPAERRELTSLANLEEARGTLERLTRLKETLGDREVGIEEIATALEMAEAAEQEGVSDAEALRARIRGRLAQEAEAQAALVDKLRRDLGTVVSEMGGRIEPDGSVVLPDALLFPGGSAELLPRMELLLGQFCWPWLSTLRDSGLDIDEIRIEGHASSEWRRAVDAREAFVRNLDLSQRRAQSVLERCLSHVPDPNDSDWARRHLTAVGYSSSRLVEVDGRENPQLSRRVVFNATLDRNRLLDDIGGEVAASEE